MAYIIIIILVVIVLSIYLQSKMKKVIISKNENELNKLNEIIATNPKNGEAFYERANIYFDLNNFDLALQDFDNAINYGFLHPYVYHNRGLSKSKLGKSKEAINDYDFEINLLSGTSYLSSPNLIDHLANAYYERGLTKGYIGDRDGALLDLNKAIEFGHKQAAIVLEEVTK